MEQPPAEGNPDAPDDTTVTALAVPLLNAIAPVPAPAEVANCIVPVVVIPVGAARIETIRGIVVLASVALKVAPA
jgi:hypothetical protein